MQIIVIDDIPQSTEEEIASRLAICTGCPSYSSGVCVECDCVVERKTLYVDSTCPLEKW